MTSQKKNPFNLGKFSKYRVMIVATALSAIMVIATVLMIVHIREAKKYAKAGEQIVELVQNIVKNYKTSPSYWGLSTSEVIAKKLYAYNMQVKDDKLVGYFGTNVEVGADENGGMVMPTAKNFVVAYKDLNKKQCIGLGEQKFDEAFWLMVKKISITDKQKSHDFEWGNEESDFP